MSSAKILVIDDEPAILNLVTAYLRAEGYTPITASDGPAGLAAARAQQPDLVVLDLMLPGLNGLDLLAQLRRTSDVYVILLTARSEEVDKIVGLSVGADDYLTKPFSPRELIARIKAALRRIQGGKTAPVAAEAPTEVVSAHIHIDPGARRVWVDDRPVELTAVEFDLLLALAQRPGRVLSREQLLESAWGYDYYGDTRVVDVHIGHIRQKLGKDELIETIRGVGYRFEDR